MEKKEPAKPRRSLPMPGVVFELAGCAAFLISPKKPAEAKGWVWYAPTLFDLNLPGPEEQWMFERFTKAELAVAGIDVGESYGSPNGRALFTAFYKEMVAKRGLSKKPCLLGRSRGGLMHYNWAVEHPRSVACIAGVYPVCDPSSWPGLAQACGAYEMTAEQLAQHLDEHCPVRRVATLAKARVPIFHIHGDADTVVPIERNSGALLQEYTRYGGEMTLRVLKGMGHDMWPGWFQNQELMDFVTAHAAGEPAR